MATGTGMLPSSSTSRARTSSRKWAGSPPASGWATRAHTRQALRTWWGSASGPIPSKALAALRSMSARLLRWREGLRALHASSPPLARDDQGHLPAGLVDHLVAEHRRAARPTFGRGVPLVGIQNQLRVLVIVLRWREHLVRDIDLPRMQHPLAVEAERRASPGYPLVAVGVLDLQVRAIDSLLVVGASCHQDPHQDVVIGVADVVTRRLLTYDERLHVDARHEVRRAEDDRLNPRARGSDFVDLDQSHRILDLRLDPDATDFESLGLLDLGEQHVQRLDLFGALDLRQHDAVKIRTSTRDDLDHVGVRPLGGPVIDANRPHLAVVAALIQCGHDVLAGIGLGERCYCIFDVHEDLIGG